jgi:tetratricopeptide (TPR) repeat protein
MRCRFHIPIAAALTLCVLLTACHSRPSLRSEGSGASARKVSADKALDQAAEAHAHFGAAVIHELNEENDAALQEYYLAAVADPNNESLILEVARRFQQQKQPEKALELLTRAASRRDATGAVFAQLGFVYSQLGKFNEAIAANRTAIKKSPQAFSGYQNLFLNHLQNKQPNEALKVLDEAAAQQRLEVEFLLSLAELYSTLAIQAPALKDTVFKKAHQVLIRAENQHPASAPLRLKLAEGFYVVGDSKKAAQLYLDLLNTLPDVPLLRERVRAKLAEIYLRGSDREHATEQLEAIIRDDPTNAQAYYFLASIALDQKQLTNAVEYFNKTILLSPSFEQAYYDLASAQLGLGQTSDALATLDKARRKFSQNFVLEFLTGLAFTRQKAYGEAITHFTSAEVIAQATDPKRLNHLFYFQLGAAFERKGDYEQAEKFFEKCLQLQPDFAEGLNYLGYMWAEHGMKLDKARTLIEKALKLEPKNAAYLDSFAWVLFKSQQPAEALEYITKAVEFSDEPDATVQDHLGDIYAALHQVEKAREAWRKSLALEENAAIRKKLEADSSQ